jgi:hypothetical protein
MRNPGYAPSRTNSIDSSIGDMGSPLDGDAEDDMTYEKLEAEAREVTDILCHLFTVSSTFIQVVKMSEPKLTISSEVDKMYSWEIN